MVLVLEKLYSGKAKDVITLGGEKVKIVFRNSISAFDGVKVDELKGKGEANCKISKLLFEILNHYGIETHYLKQESKNELICKKVEIIPVESVCRNITAGSFCRRYGVEKGIPFEKPIVELFYKNDELHDPLVTEEVAISLGWINEKENIIIKAVTLAVNYILVAVFKKIGLTLVDFKLEFGRTKDGKLILADEISADTMRLWEENSGEIKDKDRYRKDLGSVVDHYNDIAFRLEQIKELPKIKLKTKVRVTIDLKVSVLDPAGDITIRSLLRLGYKQVSKVNIGKSIVISFTSVPGSKLWDVTETISNEILANPLIETYSIDFSFE